MPKDLVLKTRIDRRQFLTRVAATTAAVGVSGCASEAPVIVSLRVEERPIGAIVVRKLVERKCGFSPLDHELFRLLAVHAAGAILSARLYSVSERKRATMHALLDLLTK